MMKEHNNIHTFNQIKNRVQTHTILMRLILSAKQSMNKRHKNFFTPNKECSQPNYFHIELYKQSRCDQDYTFSFLPGPHI